MTTNFCTATLISIALPWAAANAAQAQSNPTYVPLGPANGALYKPDSGPAPHVGLIVMHRTSNFMRSPACIELSKRGFMVMCINTRFDNNEAQVVFEQLPLDIKAGMIFLRKQPGITKVVLFGHSGGGPSMGLYQAVAESGVAYCKGSNKIVQCKDDLADLPKADGVVFADAHLGNAVLVLRALNPSVQNEDNPPTGNTIASLDPFNPANGYNPKGRSVYPAEFQKRYYEAQAARMNRLIDSALGKMRKIESGAYPYPDNDIMIVPRAGPSGSGPGASAYLYLTDPGIAAFNSTKKPAKLLKNDGTIRTGEIVSSLARPDPANATKHLRYQDGTRTFTVRSFLSANAVRANNSLDDIDYCSSNNSTACAVQSISVPVMFFAMEAYYFIADNELMFNLAKSKDKDFVVIEGATHGFTPCAPCEPSPGAYSNSMKNLFDYARDWINARF